MEGIFSVDGKAFRFFDKMSDLVILNFLWLICSLPVVTIGASTTALYSVVIKMVKDEDSYVARSFFSSFRKNFRQSTIIWGILIAVVAVLYFDFYFSSHTPMEGAELFFIPFTMIAVLILLTGLYVFPIQAFFQNSIKKTIKNSLYMALAHLPHSLLIGVISAGPCVVLFLLAGNASLAFLVDLVIGISFFAWVDAHIFVKIFERYIPKNISGEGKDMGQ